MDEAPSPLVDGHELLRRCGYKESSIYRTWIGLAGPRRRHVPLSEAQAHLEGLASKAKGCSKDIAEKRRALLSELFGVTPTAASAPATGAVVPELVELPAGLAELLGKTELPRVRKVPGELKYSLADIGGALLDKDARRSAEDLRRTLQEYPDLGRNLRPCSFHFKNQRAYDVKVGDLATVVEYIMLLPGKTAARTRAEAAKLLVRYLGGDLTLLDEVREMKHVQVHLAEVDPNHWARAFGRAVEPPSLPPEPLVVSAPPEFQDPSKGEKHLYLLYSPSLNVSRPGRTDNYERRLLEHQRTLASDAHYLLQAWNHGHLEKAVHRLFRQYRVSPRDEKIPGKIEAAELAALLPQLHQQFLAEAALQAEASSQRPADEGDAEERALKRRRMTVEVRNMELSADERELRIEKERADQQLTIEKDRADQQLTIEKDRALSAVQVEEARALAQLRVEKERWAFEQEKARAEAPGAARRSSAAVQTLVDAFKAFNVRTGSWPVVWGDAGFKRDSAVVRAATLDKFTVAKVAELAAEVC
jgi:hypothetical protein